MLRQLKTARPHLLTGQIGQATQAVAKHFLIAWPPESTVGTGSQANWPSNPPFFLIQRGKKDKGYKKEKRINPPATCLILPGLPGQCDQNPHQYLITVAHVAYITPGQAWVESLETRTSAYFQLLTLPGLHLASLSTKQKFHQTY